MKSILFFFATILILKVASAEDVATTKKCEDFLPKDTCERFRKIADEFHEKVGIVNQAVSDALKQHKQKAAQILSYVKEYLVTHATNFKCEDVISADNCKRLKDIGQKLHLTATQTALAIKEAIANGAQQVTDVYNKAVAYMRDRLSTLSCESVIGAEQCQKLKDLAKLIHAKAGEVNIAIREAIIEGASKAKDQYQKAISFLQNEVTCDKIFGKDQCDTLREAAKKFRENAKAVHTALKEALQKHLSTTKELLASVKTTLVEKAKNFQCTDVLSADQCDKFTEIGKNLTLTTKQISTAIKDALVDGAAKAKQIYARGLDFLLNDVKNLKCEDLIPAESCKNIKDFVTKVHGKTTDVALAVKEAFINGATKLKDVVAQSKDFIKAKISCENVFKQETCDKLRKTGEKFGMSLQKIDEFMREAIANGVTKLQDLYNKAKEHIMNKWKDIFGDEMDKRSIGDTLTDVKNKLKEKLIEASEKLLDAFKVTNQKVRDTVKKAIEEGKLKLGQLRSKIKEIIANLGSDDTELLDEANHLYKRSVRDQLVEALKTAHGKAKELIEQLLKLSKEKFAQIKDWIKSLKENGINIKSDELINELDFASEAVHAGVEDALSNVVEDAIQNM